MPVVFPIHDEEQIRAFAAQTGMSVSAIIRGAVAAGLKSPEFGQALRTFTSPFVQ
jgi:hypothetical protein